MLSTIHGSAAVLYYKIGTIHSALFFSSFYIIENANVTLKSIINLNNYNSIRYINYSMPFQIKPKPGIDGQEITSINFWKIVVFM
jgi:hypothetical protein